MDLNPTLWKIYTRNPEAWAAMVAACEKAEDSIELENFIFTPDEIGNKFIEVCARKAAAGVRVRFIWDAAGSFSFFGSSIAEDLKKKGIELLFFKTLLPGFFNIHNYKSWYLRNHRRTLVIDGKIGFTGSICISKRMEAWRDTVVEIEGPVVKDMRNSFERMWLRAQGKKVNKRIKKIARLDAMRHDHEFKYVTNSPFPRQHYLSELIAEAMRTAQTSITITTPYFVPTRRLGRILRLAALRGVDVRILLPKSSDFPTVDLGARTFFHSLLKGGIRIFLYTEGMIHAKSIVIDGNWSSVGTLNFDTISLLYNFEANIVTHNTHFADDLMIQFEKDLQNAKEVTFEDWNNRFFVEKIATFLVKFIRGFL